MSATIDPPAADLAALAARLESCRRNGSYVLSGQALEAQELDDLLGAVDLKELTLAQPQLSRSDDRLTLAGTLAVLGLQLDGETTFTVVDDALCVGLTATYPDEDGIRILGLPWATVTDLRLALQVTGPSLIVPLVSIVVSGRIHLDGRPIDVELAPSGGGWRMTARHVPLPDLETLAHLLDQKPAAVSPPSMDAVGGFEIVELRCEFGAEDLTVHSLSAVVGAPGREWELAPGAPKLRDVSLHAGVEFEAGEVESFSVGAAATVTLGSLDLPVRVDRESDGLWRVGIIGAQGFPSFGELVETATDKATAALLPTGLRELRMRTASLELTIGDGEPTLRTVEFGARMAEHWPIVEGYLALERVALQLRLDRAADDFSGYLSGALLLGDVELPVSVQRPGGSAPWTLTLGNAATRTLPGLSSLGGVVGGDVTEHLPAGFGDGALTLNDLTLEFDPETNAVSRIKVDVLSVGPWSLPELSEFDVRDLTLQLDVKWPSDAARRDVTGTIEGTVNLAGPTIKISASKPSSTAPWELAGALQPGPPLDLLVLASRALPGGPSLPAGLPGLALTTADLRLTPATGAFAVRAGSAGPWPIPLGFTTLSISALDLELARERTGADLTGALGGTFALAGVNLRAEYRLPGDLLLRGEVESLGLAALIDEIAGSEATASMPEAFRTFELRDLVFSVAPAQGRFEASAAVPGFDAVALSLEPGGFALAFAPAASWRLSALSADLAVLDDLSFGGTVLVLSTAADASAVAGLPVVRDRLKLGRVEAGRGLTLIADLSLDGTGADRLLGLSALRVRAAIESPEKLELEATIGGPFPLGGGVELKEVDFRLRAGAAEFELALLTRIVVTFDPTSRLTFVGALAVTPNKASGAITMLGTWDEPFGAKGVSISDVALEIESSYEGVPGVGIAGKLGIGDFHGEMALKFDAEVPSKSVVVLRFNALKLGDLLAQLCHEVFGDVIPEDLVRTVFDISFEDVEIYVVPQDTTIGELKFEAGTRLRARMFFWGLQADARVDIDYQKGLLVHGDLDPIVLGDVFELRGAAGKPKPMVHLEISDGKLPTADISGRVKLLGIVSETQIELSDTGFLFTTTGTLFDLFTASLEVRGGHLGDTNGFLVTATMQNDLFEYLRTEAHAALKTAAESVDASIASARKDVEAARGEIGSLDEQIAARRRQVQAERAENQRVLATSQTTVVDQKRAVVTDLNNQIVALTAQIQADRARDTQALIDAERDVTKAQGDVNSLLAQMNATRTVIQSERDLANRRLLAAQADVDAAQRNVDSILAEIRKNEAWWRSIPDIDWPDKPNKTRDSFWYGPKIGGLYTAYGTATGALQSYRGILEGIKQGAHYSPIDGDPRMVGLVTAYGIATAALQTATGLVQATRAVQTAPPIEADPRLVVLVASREVAQAALDTAVGALQLISAGAEALPVDADPVVISLTAARETAYAGLALADGVLEGARVTAGGTLQVADYIAQYGLGGLIDVRYAMFTAGLDLANGGEVRLVADVEFLGEPQHIEFDFNFQDLASSVDNLVKELVPG